MDHKVDTQILGLVNAMLSGYTDRDRDEHCSTYADEIQRLKTLYDKNVDERVAATLKQTPQQAVVFGFMSLMAGGFWHNGDVMATEDLFLQKHMPKPTHVEKATGLAFKRGYQVMGESWVRGILEAKFGKTTIPNAFKFRNHIKLMEFRRERARKSARQEVGRLRRRRVASHVLAWPDPSQGTISQERGDRR